MNHNYEDPTCVNLSCLITALLSAYLLIASVGYFINGNNSKDNILMSLPYRGLRMSIEILITVHAYFAVVLCFNPMAQEMEEYLKIPTGKLICISFLISVLDC